jgi:hypothetical protein
VLRSATGLVLAFGWFLRNALPIKHGQRRMPMRFNINNDLVTRARTALFGYDKLYWIAVCSRGKTTSVDEFAERVADVLGIMRRLQNEDTRFPEELQQTYERLATKT